MVCDANSLINQRKSANQWHKRPWVPHMECAAIGMSVRRRVLSCKGVFEGGCSFISGLAAQCPGLAAHAWTAGMRHVLCNLIAKICYQALSEADKY